MHKLYTYKPKWIPRGYTTKFFISVLLEIYPKSQLLFSLYVYEEAC